MTSNDILALVRQFKEDIGGLIGRRLDLVRVREKLTPFLKIAWREQGSMFDRVLVREILTQVPAALDNIESCPDVWTAAFPYFPPAPEIYLFY